ncbi:MAG TPA: ABC transporter permease [Candidatus Acidoferrum sp.]|nr:ABC transporter permease [Candidatus Acidoferrum sp.]
MNTLRNIWIICQKELRTYFVSPIAYILFIIYAAIFGFFFWNMVGAFVYYSMESQLRGEMFPMNINDQVIRQLFGNINVINLLIIPLMTMRLFAEEKRNGTIELLATSPIRDGEVILGKWLASVGLYAAMLLFTCLNFLFLFKYGNPDWKPMAVSLLGVLLQAAALLAIGMFISSMTRNQIIAGAVTFGVCLIVFVLGWVGEYQFSTWARVATYLSTTTHMQSFLKGVIDTKDAIYYVSAIFLGLFLTARSLESLRWRA